MIELLNGYKVVSMLGTAKNAGKTTTLNYLLNQLYGKKKIGLTSIGRDGEMTDVITNTAKPRIYIEKGTIAATAKNCLKSSDFTVRILETTNIFTPLGEVVITEALSDGYIDLAGPSVHSGIRRVIGIFKRYGVDLVLIDGAVGKKGLADNFISEASILCTGASLSTNMDEVVRETKTYLEVLSLPLVTGEEKKMYTAMMAESRVTVIEQDGLIKNLNLKTALNNTESIVSQLGQNSAALLINGALSEETALALLHAKDRFKTLQIVIPNGTKCFLTSLTLEKLSRRGITIRVLEYTKVLCLTYNPVSPFQYFFDDQEFRNRLNEVIDIPIYNVLEGKK